MPQYPLSLPDDEPAAKLSLTMNNITRANRSPYTRAGGFESYDYGWWGLTITIPPVSRTLGQRWMAFLAALNGRAGTFQCRIPGHEKPLGEANENPGVPRVNGAGQTGDRIAIDGVPSGVFRYLDAGDFVQISTRLYMITERVNTNNQGGAWLSIWPHCEGHADDVRVIVSGAMGLFRLTEDTRQVDIVEWNTYGATITAEEAV